MRICIIGAGAMGSLYGALLAQSGSDVVLFDTWLEHVRAIQEGGLRLGGITGDIHARVSVTNIPDEIGTVDMCFVQVNTNMTGAAADIAAQVLGQDGFCLTLQNGVGNIETLTSALGAERVIGGLSYHSAAMAGPGHAVHTHKGPTWLGEIDGQKSERILRLSGLLAEAGFTPTLVDDIVGFIWGKFIHNCSINALCAVLGIRVGEIPMYPAADEFQTGIINEAVAVVRAKGISIPDADPLSAIKDFCRVKFNKPSMLQHVEAGKPTEIGALNKVVVEEGKRLNIPTPRNEALSLLIAAIDSRNQFRRDGVPDFDALESANRERYGVPG